MKIDFNSIEERSIPNFKGGEKALATRMFTDGNGKIMKARLEPGASIGTHTHCLVCDGPGDLEFFAVVPLQ